MQSGRQVAPPFTTVAKKPWIHSEISGAPAGNRTRTKPSANHDHHRPRNPNIIEFFDDRRLVRVGTLYPHLLQPLPNLSQTVCSAKLHRNRDPCREGTRPRG